ncbi:kinase-like domain-containing protein [Trichophaea hybrida]|nr:kinase-like domain-containing protein [Trichophaea hybrida]
MKCIQYGDLGKHLTEPWTEVDAILITIQLLEGLVIMHNLGITHRNLQPENIFVVSLSPILVKIGDFGVQNNDTVLQTYCGMTTYMASTPLATVNTPNTQIWSRGCVVHRILTG